MKNFLKRQKFSFAIVTSVVAACLWPQAFDTWCGVKLLKLISPAIGLIMFGMGTTLALDDFLRVAKMPVAVLTGVVLQFLVMPFVGWGLATAFGFDGEIGAGIVLVGSVAGGTASNVVSYLAKANVALSVTMTCISTLLSPFLTPVMMKLLAGKMVEVDATAMMIGILQIVLIPVLAGTLVHWLFHKSFERHKAVCDGVLSFISSAGICFTLLVLTAQSQTKFREAGLVIFAVAVMHNSIGYLSGYWITRLLGRFFKFDERDARTVAIEVGMQNGGMAGALANDVLHSATAALPANVFSIWMNFSGSILASFWSRRSPQTTSSE
ncbi:MAG: bile acid:sodium symporter family protein [bacterium]|nr:bile acid:sodium symporter family protein [bacterium]